MEGILSVHADAAVNRQYLASWFHWVPHGAFLLIDEAQMVWPSSWTAKDLAELDYPGGVQVASQDNRPANFVTAFEMHRHYGWDLVLTTPDIQKIRKDIRGCSEGAYKHKNQALIGIKGRYLEGFHMAEDNGKSNADFLTTRMRKIRKEVWGLYESTATGTVTDTRAGLSLFQNPRVLVGLGLVLMLLVFVGTRPAPVILDSSRAKEFGTARKPGSETKETLVQGVTADRQAVPLAHQGHSVSSGSVVSGAVSPGPVVPVVLPLEGARFRIVGESSQHGVQSFMFEVMRDDLMFGLRSSDLRSLGYRIDPINSCLVRLWYASLMQVVTCGRRVPLDDRSMPSASSMTSPPVVTASLPVSEPRGVR